MRDLNDIIDEIEVRELYEDMYFSLYSIPRYYQDEENKDARYR